MSSPSRHDRSLRIGIYGGTFNPVHTGHLVLAEHVRELFGLDKVLFVPSGTPPHKNGRFPSGKRRLHMVRRAIEGNRSFEALDMEVRRRGPSYTASTLRELRDLHPAGTVFYFLIGMDAFKEITTWHEAEELTALARFVIFPRPGHPLEDPAPFLPPPRPGPPVTTRPGIRRYPVAKGRSIYLAAGPLVDISSTAIRERIRKNRSIRYLVPEQVAAYIARTKIYT